MDKGLTLSIRIKQAVKNVIGSIDLVFAHTPKVSVLQKIALIYDFFSIDKKVECQHFNFEMLEIAKSILTLPKDIEGVLVEAGAYKGGSTVKLSLIARLVQRKLVVFDSFTGLPPNNETYSGRDGLFFRNEKGKTNKKIHKLFTGQYTGSLKEVKSNVETYGVPEVCIFVKGFFKETMPAFKKKIAVVFIDVDLASSTKTCLRYLYPLLQNNGVFFSHDGHLGWVTDVYKDLHFWKKKVGVEKPLILGLGKRRLLKIIKSNNSETSEVNSDNNIYLYIAWMQAVIATLGSLFFSEVMKLVPCTLCWYQRILMYPLVFILFIGMVKKDKTVFHYVLPLSGLGSIIALYHNLLYYKLLPESVHTCTLGVSCTTRYIEWFGFVTIPLLSLTAFVIINVCMYLIMKHTIDNSSQL